jgi:starch-binding outer membrane protein, SusD/RagB family
MKRIINGFFLMLFSASLMLGSCSKSFINKTPFNSLPFDQALGTESGLQNALDGAYGQLRAVALYGRDFPVVGDLQADNTYVETKNTGRYLEAYNYTVTVTEGTVGEMWPAAYTGILSANQIINAKVTGGKVDQIKAQAYAIRALLYFKLVTIYATPFTDDPNALGVPLILSYNPYALPTRNTVKEIYTQIISDLTKAIQTAPAYTSSVTLSKYAIEGILARVYLYMGDNTNAKNAALDVINASGFNLVSPANYQAFWADPTAHTDQVEVMFEVDCDILNNNGFDDLGGIYVNGYQDLYCSSQLFGLYSATDIRTSVILDGFTKAGPGAKIVNKFPNALNPDRDNLKVIRLAEVYLVAAEASLPGNEVDASKYLNLLMAQRDPAFAGYTDTGINLLNDVVQERRKELAFEGDRFYDLNRLKQQINRGANIAAIPAPLTINYPDSKRLAPIPQAEIQANPNIAKQQNPGY